MEDMGFFFVTLKIMLVLCFIVLACTAIYCISPFLKEFLFPPCSKCRYCNTSKSVGDHLCEKVVDRISGHPLYCYTVRGSHKCFFEAANK